MKQKLLTLISIMLLPMAMSTTNAKANGITDIPDSIPIHIVHYQDSIAYCETKMVPYVESGIAITKQDSQTNNQGPKRASTSSTTWTIGSGGNFTDINAAMSDSRVVAGDVLQLKSHTILTGTQTISKAIHLKGNGYEMDSDGKLSGYVAQIQGYLQISAEGVSVSNLAINYFSYENQPNTTYIPYIRISSEHSVIEGCYIRGGIYGYANNATIRQCFFHSLRGGSYSRWTIQNNIIASPYSNGYDILVNLKDATIDHNIIYSEFKAEYTSNYLASSISSSTITNNLIVHFPSDNKYTGTYTGTISPDCLTSNTVNHNVFSGSSPNSNNRGGVNAREVIFDNERYGSNTNYDAYFHFVANSPATGYASDGGDCGPWSGKYPYVVGGSVGSEDDISYKNGDFFTAQTAEGVKIRCLVISAQNKTCQIGIGNSVCLIDKKTSGIVTIPKTIKGLTVTTIGNYAFQNCSSLISVTIPNSVTSIGNYAFSGCSGLTSIAIPNSVTSIGNYAFSGCSGLTSVTIPNSVTSIGDNAFSECYFRSDTFINNSTLTNSGNWGATLCDEVTNDGLLIKRHVVVKCRPWATIVTIPGSVTSIGNYAFRGCSSLTSVTIPNSVTSIGSSAFQNCSGLTSVTIPDTVTSIGNYAFYNCSGLTSVTIPNSVTSIGYDAFSNCSGLTSINIPESVTSISNNAFSGCSGLTSIKVGAGNTKYDSRNDCNAIIETATNTLIAGCKNTTIPNSVTSIGNYAFSGCSGLTSITIPNSVTNIGNGAFYECSGLTSVTIPNSVTSIGSSAFYYCSGLTSVTIPNDLRHHPQQRDQHRQFCLLLLQRPDLRHHPEQCDQHRKLSFL